MATDTLDTLVSTIKPDENSDAAYERVYGNQVKPCDFRRWFTLLKCKKPCDEISEETAAAIAGYIAEDMTIEEAFATHCPDYVGPGEFAHALRKFRRAQPVAK
jgi:hypothetical protein